YALKVLNKKQFDTEGFTSEDLDNVYDEILGQVDQYFSLYDKNKFRQVLHDGREKFVQLPIDNVYDGNKLKSSGKREMLVEIMNGLHASPTEGKIESLGGKTPFGKMQFISGIDLSKESMLCYQSPTGIFERRVALKDL